MTKEKAHAWLIAHYEVWVRLDDDSYFIIKYKELARQVLNDTGVQTRLFEVTA